MHHSQYGVSTAHPLTRLILTATPILINHVPNCRVFVDTSIGGVRLVSYPHSTGERIGGGGGHSLRLEDVEGTGLRQCQPQCLFSLEELSVRLATWPQGLRLAASFLGTDAPQTLPLLGKASCSWTLPNSCLPLVAAKWNKCSID